MIICGDSLTTLRALSGDSVQCCVTSPPYWGLRDYGHAGQIGLERTPDEYVARMVEVFREVRRVLKPDGVLWLNLGDSYAAARGGTHQPAETLAGGRGGHGPGGERVNRDRHDGYNPTRNAGAIGLKHKDLVGIPWRVAFALQADGWWLRSDIIWSKPNPMPESVTDRPTRAHEYIFLLSKSERYFYNSDAIKEPGTYSADERKGRADTRRDHPLAARMMPKKDKQRGHGRRHAGFNDRWGSMSKAEQCGVMRNKRSVWNIATRPFSEAHFATFPEEIPTVCILAGSSHGDTVLDPFSGAGTVGVVCEKTGRHYIGIELNPAYVAMSERRIAGVAPLFSTKGAA